MIDNNCISCHDAGGTSPELTSYDHIASEAAMIFNSLSGTGVKLMPLGGPELNDTIKSQFSCWIAQGKKNN